MARQVEITQNSKFAISLHFKKKVSDEVDFLQANRHESLLQLDAMILMGIAKHSQSFQNSTLPMSILYVK